MARPQLLILFACCLAGAMARRSLLADAPMAGLAISQAEADSLIGVWTPQTTGFKFFSLDIVSAAARNILQSGGKLTPEIYASGTNLTALLSIMPAELTQQYMSTGMDMTKVLGDLAIAWVDAEAGMWAGFVSLSYDGNVVAGKEMLGRVWKMNGMVTLRGNANSPDFEMGAMLMGDTLALGAQNMDSEGLSYMVNANFVKSTTSLADLVASVGAAMNSGSGSGGPGMGGNSGSGNADTGDNDMDTDNENDGNK